MSSNNLLALRRQIDELDQQIQHLITERARIAAQVAHAKNATEASPSHFYRAEREAEILREVINRNQQGPLSNESMVAIFREIISACLALQKPLAIAYLGPEGTYSHEATLKHFGHAAQSQAVSTIEDVFKAVENDTVQYGVVPIENSTEGSVNQTLDCLANTTLKICGEITLPIHHLLLSEATHLNEVTDVYAHQQALAQCRHWLNAHVAHAKRHAVSSNAEAARLAQQNPKIAAIAGKMAAELYQLNRLAEHIEDHAHNATRFVILGKRDVPPSGNDKTSLLFSISRSNRSGVLFHLLQPFSENDINMTRIESRPSRQSAWDYVFFVDIEGHHQDAKIAQALQAMAEHAVVTHLGSYPKQIA